MIKGYWISAKRPLERRCRAGHCFDQAGHGIAADALADEHLAALQADPWLVVEETEFEPDTTAAEPASEGPLAEDVPAAPGAGAAAPGQAQAALHEYLAGLKAAGEGKPKVAQAREATGIAALSAAEIAAAWRALE